MYPETILFMAGGSLAVISAVFAAWLAFSHKQGRNCRKLLEQETQSFNALISTTASYMDSGDSPTVYGVSADKQKAEINTGASPPCVDFSILEDRYILKKTIHDGSMSKVYLAENRKLGNEWIVKYIPARKGRLSNEENILKLLNHTGLPKITDIFHNAGGAYIIESFIEGVTLDKVIKLNGALSEPIVMDWAGQLSHVLNYLHTLKPYPIYHFDLKPSNIIVTHDNRLVIIDFGISKQYGANSAADGTGFTYAYAAPEQIKGVIPPEHAEVVSERLGSFTGAGLKPDARTDIYSLGVILFELAAGRLPSLKNRDMLKDAVSKEFFEIIDKCLALNPAERWQTVNELESALEKAKNGRLRMVHTLFIRRLVSVSAIVLLALSAVIIWRGYLISAAALSLRPQSVTLSLQQSIVFDIKKQYKDGSPAPFAVAGIKWAYSNPGIAQMDGNRIIGLNAGESDITGIYGSQRVYVHVNVVEPMSGWADIAQYYMPGRKAEIYAGNNGRAIMDGNIAEAGFVSPESIAVGADGAVYITDAGALRVIKDGQVRSIKMEGDYLQPRIVRCFKNEVYILTNNWEEDDEVYYEIDKFTGTGTQTLHKDDGRFSSVEDFAVSEEGCIYFIDRNPGIGGVYLKKFTTPLKDDFTVLCELPDGTSSLDVGDGCVYLANPVKGAVYVWKNGALNYFAGLENKKDFIDGTAPLFYAPMKIKYENGFLFVWDFNTLRRIAIKDGAAAACETVAGEAGPDFNLEITKTRQAAEDIILPNSAQTDFAVSNGDILLTDPKRGAVWLVKACVDN